MNHEEPEDINTETLLRRPLPNNWFRNDVALSLGVAVLGLFFAYLWWLAGPLGIQLGRGKDVELWPLTVSVILTSATLAFRRQYPITSGLAGTVMLLVFGQFLAVEPQTSQVVLYVGFYSIGAWSWHRRAAFFSRLILLAAIFFWLVHASYLILTVSGQSPAAAMTSIIAQWLINLIFYFAAWYFGDKSWRAFLDQRKLHATLRELWAAQDTIAAQAVQEERFHIARELHDVVAHHVTVMGIHASAARRVLSAEVHPNVTGGKLISAATAQKAIMQIEQVETTSSQAVTELQNLVYTLRDRSSHSSRLPDISHLDDLVAEANSGPQNVTLQVVGEQVDSTAAINLTLYRVAQEALSNARKHAGAQANIDVRLRYSSGLIELDVSDDGRRLSTRRPEATIGTGTGIAGMRERMTAVGGSLEVGPKSRGGWLVRASVPCGATHSTAPVLIKNDSKTENCVSKTAYKASSDKHSKGDRR